MTKRYYSLRFERSDALHHAGERLLNADNLLHIGQTQACEVRLSNDSQYEDAELAVIEKRTDEKGWKLICLSPYKEHEVRINGTPVNHVHFLNDGDRIAFEGQRQELLFNIHEDEQYNTNKIVAVGKDASRMLSIWMTVITLSLLSIGAYLLYSRPVTSGMIAEAKVSVFKIKVDSVMLRVTRGDSTFTKSKVEVDNVFGTAFLSTDRQLVTARHCIEPWLNIADDIELDTLAVGTPDYVKMALEAVTNNVIADYMGDNARWEVVSHCSLRKPEQGDSVLLTVKSTDFIFDDSRDEIVECGDFEHQYFWRSITVRPRRIDMMLGDIAYLPCNDLLTSYKGTIRLATRKEMKEICQKPNQPIAILGRTTTDTGNKQIQSPDAKLSGTLEDKSFDDEGFPNVVIAQKGSIEPGFSGGPIIARVGLWGWRVIGVVSVKDSHDKDRFYSVPITEIERMKATQNQE